MAAARPQIRGQMGSRVCQKGTGEDRQAREQSALMSLFTTPVKEEGVRGKSQEKEETRTAPPSGEEPG